MSDEGAAQSRDDVRIGFVGDLMLGRKTLTAADMLEPLRNSSGWPFLLCTWFFWSSV